MYIHVEHAGHDLMDCVERRPHAHALAEPIEELVGKRAEISVLVRNLALAKIGDKRVALLFQIFIAGARIHQRHGREIMTAGEVST